MYVGYKVSNSNCCSCVISVHSVAALKSAHGASDHTAAAADAVDMTSPSLTDVGDHGDDAMTTAELKQAIVAMMKRKDDVDDDNRSVH